MVGGTEISLRNYLVLTDMGLEKNKDFTLKKPELQKVKEAIKESCGRGETASFSADSNTCHCGS